MPGIYCAVRSHPPGRAGLALPYTPTTGPIRIGVDTATFVNSRMSYPWEGDFSTVDGVKTEGMDGCMVVCVVEWNGANWGAGYFHHIAGGSWFIDRENTFQNFLGRVQNPQNCFSVVMAHSAFGVSEVTEKVARYFPLHLASVYLTQVSTSHVAVARFGGLFGEYFDDGRDKGPSYLGNGHVGPVT